MPTIDSGELYIQYSGAKVKLDSINQLVSVIKVINGKLSDADVATTRAWVHKIQKTHPLVDEEIKDLEYFKPISDEVGSTYLMHTPDTQTLALDDWATELPNPFRRTLEVKMDESYSKVNEAYYNLNSAMSRNISTEYFEERKDQGDNVLGKSLLSNDFHIAGDYTFGTDHVGLLENTLMIALITLVGGAGKLISWLTPVNTYDVAMEGPVQISVEGDEVLVNLRGDKAGVIATIIDETSISPTTETECKE